MTAPPESMQARQAALLLHGLPAAARRQVLSRLDADQQAQLVPLLNELIELGVPVSAAAASVDVPASSALDRAAALSADVVAQCLQSCAAPTLASLLQARAWPWRLAVLDQMSSARRGQVADCLRSEPATLAPAVLSHWCERLCAQAAQLPAANVQPRAGLRRFIPWKR